jgi:dienelactone hydrolase
VVLFSHGLWITCADRTAWDEQDYVKLSAWPCAAGTPAIPSYRGYDYLGRALAAQGMIVISISANGVMPLMGQDQDAARAALINEHLRMWQQLSSTGGGPLGGKVLSNGGAVDFHGHADLTTVGLMGHSRGGRGTLLQAADVNQRNWPTGVKIKAVVPLAAAEPYSPDDNPDNPEYTPYRITNIPVAAFVGSCDRAVNGRLFHYLSAHNTAPLYEYYVRGANHDFYNTQWSPSSGQVGAYDDAATDNPPSPGHCTSNDDPKRADKQLTETHQYLVSTTYLSAFFRRYLLNDTRMTPILNGSAHPLPFASIDLQKDLP